MDLYIYYRVHRADRAFTLDRVRALQAELRPDARAARLLRRPDADGDVETWMETYEGVPVGFEARLAAATEAHAPRTVGLRHVERFVEID